MAALTEKAKRLAAMKKARQKVTAAAQRQQHTIIALGSAYGLGFAEKRAFRLPTIPNVAPEVTYGAVSLITSFMVKNAQVQRIAQSLGDGMLSVALYKAGKFDFGKLFKVSGQADPGFY